MNLICTSVRHEALERQTQRRLSDRDRDLFLKMLDEDVEPNEARKQSARRYNRLRKQKLTRK